MKPEKLSERRMPDPVRALDTSQVGRIRLGRSTDRPFPPPARIERWRLTSPAGDGSKHLGGRSLWRRLKAALRRLR